MAIALALGADFVMLGRYFACFDESPSNVVNLDGQLFKEYWGEGSQRARNVARYDQGDTELPFEEGVDGYVPYAGSEPREATPPHQPPRWIVVLPAVDMLSGPLPRLRRADQRGDLV